jgi:Fe-S-cluster containining protein
MKIEKDLAVIKKIAKEKEDENWRFRSFLKQIDMKPEEVDVIVHDIYEEVSARIDCTECGNCCKEVKPIMDQNDITRFSEGLNMTVSEFRTKYLIEDTENPEEFVFNSLSCPFLENNKCSNYDYRPEVCDSYPHLHKKEFVYRLFGVISNYEICPIVFNVYERLKGSLWHYHDFDEDDF